MFSSHLTQAPLLKTLYSAGPGCHIYWKAFQTLERTKHHADIPVDLVSTLTEIGQQETILQLKALTPQYHSCSTSWERIELLAYLF